MSENYVDFSSLDDTNESYTVTNGKAIPKFNQNTQKFKWWATRRHSMNFKVVDVFNVIAKGNKMLYANIKLLLDHTDKNNLLMKRVGNRYSAVKDEEAIMDLLQIKKTAWYKIRPIIFNETLPILAKCTIQAGDEEYTNYYINPLLSSDYRGISLTCYLLFRKYLKPYISASDYYTLEKHAKAFTGEDNELTLPHEQLKETNFEFTENESPQIPQ